MNKNPIEEIRRWNEVAALAEETKNYTELKELLTGITGFRFPPIGLPSGLREDMHVYPGIRYEEDRPVLTIYVIFCGNDHRDSYEHLERHLVEADTLQTLAGDGIPPQSPAAERIALWGSDFRVWLQETTENRSILRAFNVPGGDMMSYEEYHAYFGLIPLRDSTGPSFRADLTIISYGVAPAPINQDTVMPVPPFGLGVLAKECYYLLNDPAL